MKFELDSNSDSLLIRSYSKDHIMVGDQRLDQAFVVAGRSIHTDILPPQFPHLTASHLDRLAELRVDIVILGTGQRQQFLDFAITRSLLERGIGLETMDTAAACRCYNVLAAENRSVAAALYMIESVTR